MATRLSETDVRKIAALARLELSPEEVGRFSKQLADILAYVDEIQQVDTAGVEPTSHPLGDSPAWREDELVPSLDRAVVLENAPSASKQAGLFKTPKVL